MSQAHEDKRIALVTGAARGIGRAIAERLARDGISLVLGDVERDLLDQTVGEFNAAGREAHGLVLDVSSEDSVAAAMAEIARRFGRLDIVVNNAGIMPRVEGRNPRVEETPLAIWQATLAVNLTGTFLVCRAAIPLLRKSRSGRIVNISSRAARMSTSGNSHYSASKAGIIGFSRVLAKELGPEKITVNCIAPSAVENAMHQGLASAQAHIDKLTQDTPLRRLATGEDIANGVAFLASDQANFITGTILDVNGGSYMA
ncbi:SDR family NAD(P)-dependent oxidoreductase [Bosea caraganae]|uniref:SDR family NAD(P)-dependent oxidoreductase n=1 Tax=Bosea caraganae TaxID=2763117 RepID=A0A370L985_9HYPH|nr:SDR family NAD(P)-dependent oxidoreductase [Bosea caraganae]RDJ26939.1 SDR family NAD(P)-dependent oxidoreductase [Bosea caraganae]RDJ30826.1 SDR family NAD(P)-dependent oxidoreductase [Bosea caraganae]